MQEIVEICRFTGSDEMCQGKHCPLFKKRCKIQEGEKYGGPLPRKS